MKTRGSKKVRRFLTTLAAPLLAALVVAGAIAILALLRHYRTHDIAERRRQSELRDATVAARAKLAADAMGMLFSDMQTALAGTLNAVPREGTLSFLERWREVNPLVSTALPVNARGTPGPGNHWPAEMIREYQEASRAPDGLLYEKNIPPALRDWLAKTPWHPGAIAEKPLPPAAPDAAPASAPAWKPLREKLRAAAARDPYYIRGAPDAGATPAAIAAGSIGNLPSGDDYTKVEPWSERRRRLGIPFAERAGWDAVPGGLFAWRMSDDDMVLVASVDLQELAAMLAGALPSRTEDAGDCALLTDADGNAPATATATTNTAATINTAAAARDDIIRDFPVHPDLLPGWAIRAIRKPAGADIFPRETIYDGAAATVILAAGLALLLLLVFQRRMRENEKTALVADYASHEIRTQVQTILGFAENNITDVTQPVGPDLASGRARVGGHTGNSRPDTRSGPTKNCQLRNISNIIHGAARRLTETTTLILNFSPKLIRGGKIHTGNVNLCQAAAELLEEFGPWLQEEVHMELTSSLPAAPVRAITNDIAFSIILQNLLYNAGLHAAVGGRVKVSLAENPAAGMIELSVRDYGPGVPRGELKRIFDPRRRRDRQEHGHGIGLPFSRSLARATGGDLVCEIPADGAGGSVFILSMPKAPQENN
ncbi:MAG: HAMP domain-containing histidine kinase [Opitutaceae bacterium]|jgi:signal transduction histidine kinase|nr:HAMP domain-containing histidine kinase [Opitutaceae bacterium]